MSVPFPMTRGIVWLLGRTLAAFARLPWWGMLVVVVASFVLTSVLDM